MDSIRIIQLPTKSAAGTDDYIAVDSTANGTKKIQFPNLLDDGLTIQNKAADAKATGDAINAINGAIGNEASTRQSADANLQTQIDQLIAPSGEAPSAAEIENARIGAPPENTVYPTLGDAIRGQFSDVKSDLTNYESRTAQIESGTYNDADGVEKWGQTARVRNANVIPINNITSITIPTGYSAWIYRLDSSKTLIGQGGWRTGTVEISEFGANTAFINFTIKDTANPSADLTAKVADIQNGFKFIYDSDEESFEYARNSVKPLIAVPKLKNGTPLNNANAECIRTFEITPVTPNTKVSIFVDLPLPDSSYNYYYLVYLYSIDSGEAGSASLVTWEDPYMVTESNLIEVSIPSNVKGIAVALTMINSSNVYYPLRVENINTEVIKIVKEPQQLTDLKAKLYTQLNREAFAYIGDGGSFVFKDDAIFDGSGRCAWKTTSDILIKLPNLTFPKSFSVEDIVSALTSDDLYNDGSTTWVYLRAGRALVYNDETETVETVAINAGTPLADKTYPILMVWSAQAVGGMLYDKFLHDVQTVKINQAISGGGASGIATEINNARHIAGDTATPLTLLHFSDPHADTDAINRILAEADNYSNSIDEMICTGDMVANTAGQIASWWNPSVLTCIGNHDSASYSEGSGYNWTALSMANRDAYYIAPFESNWGITHTTGTSYYYKDYATQKIRLIVMDAMLYTDNGAEATAQTSWLANLLSDAIANNLHTLIAIHSAHGGASPIECSFSRYNQGIMPTYSDCNTPQIVIDTVATAIGNGLKFIGYIVGHTHQDNMWDAENDGTQLMYCITCTAVSQRAQWINSDQNRSITEDAYNLVTIDTANTLVKIVRGGGANIDDHMRTRKAICFNYSTGEMVGEVL